MPTTRLLGEFGQYLTQLSLFQNGHHCELKQVTRLGGPLVNLLRVTFALILGALFSNARLPFSGGEIDAGLTRPP